MITSWKLIGSATKIAASHFEDEAYFPEAAPGVRIYGELAARLGFTAGASITEADLVNLLSGRSAAGEQVGREHKVLGVDLTFSAPKSVSVAALLTDRDPAIVAAHDRAVLNTMLEIERKCAGSRNHRMENGEPAYTSVITGSWVYVTVRNVLNHHQDPHLHTHAVIMNMTHNAGKIRALDGQGILRPGFNQGWGAKYRSKLTANLKAAGHSVSSDEKRMPRLDSVPLAVEREFSKRRDEIAAAKGRGVSDDAAWRVTHTLTPKRKDGETTQAGLLAGWRERLARHEGMVK